MTTLFALPTASATEPPRVIFLGDSLTAGYALDADQAYPALIQRKLDAAGLSYRVINSGISGDTTAGGLRRIDWLLRRPATVVVIALGANDGLRGFPPGETARNLDAIVRRIKETSPETRVLIAGMRLPANLGPSHVKAFEAVFPEIAERHNLPLMPFLLEGVAGNPELNLPDGIHPNADGQKILAEHMWRFLRPYLDPATP